MKNFIITIMSFIFMSSLGFAQTNPILGDLHLNGMQNAVPGLVNNNKNAILVMGPPQFPGCIGRFGRFCRLDPITLQPDGRYDLIRYLNANYIDGQFNQVDPQFDVWIDGPCIADNPQLSGFDIGWAPQGGTGTINLQTRLRINTEGKVGLGTATPEHDLDVNGNPDIANPVLNGNANAIMAFGPGIFPGCRGRIGRFCRLNKQTLLPDGRYDLIRYMNAHYNEILGCFNQIDPNFDTWIDGPCIADNPANAGFDIAHAAAGQDPLAPLNPKTRFHINGFGKIGLGTANPEHDLDVNGNVDAANPVLNGNANAIIALGPNNFPGCRGRFGRFCRLNKTTLLPDGRYDLIRYMNAHYNEILGCFTQIDPAFDVWIDGPCIADDPALTGFDIAHAPAGQIPGAPLSIESRFRINGEGNIGIGFTDNLGQRLNVNGNVGAVEFINISDRRYKQNIKSLESSLQKIMQLRGVTYQFQKEAFEKFRFDDRTHLGFIAQEIQDVLPETVYENKEGFLSVNYSGVIPVLVEAVKELEQENRMVKAQNEELKSQLSQIESKLEYIESMLTKHKTSLGEEHFSQDH